ncbi:Transcriptional coactivator Hfi1/Transcriptional adapter 1 [Corchorus olitorius]|uniref:Transcriptional coactivator Hfi1/Transcriptional adapter 1 n=1 Tax=Corchorus olitorius TaxID=93759 RepID=A0A1R3J718_9ROSI|nr:Transcriptional coactivator Hfi1/Transcriptional adapter 1 [Corchorus olitorius]
MQPPQGSRIDLGELKSQIVKRIGAERSKRYFYNLSRFLSQKLSKSDFDKSCYHILGRENLPLHNQLIRSILKNACQAKTPPPVHEAGPAKSLIQTVKSSPGREDGHEQTTSLVPNQNMAIWSNGVLPVSSPRKVRSGIRDRKFRDRPSPLGPNGKVDSVSHQLMGMEDNANKLGMENGDLTPYDYQRPVQHLQAVAEQPEIEREGLGRAREKPRVPSKDQTEGVISEDGEEVEQANHIKLSRSPLLAPLGIPFCSASVGGARKAMPVASGGNFVSYYDSGGLYDAETLRKRMEQIAAAQGLGGVSVECASMLNNMVDVYLKKLIRSCVDLVGSRSTHDLRKHSAHKLQSQGKLVNGMWPSNHLHMQSSSGPTTEVMQEQGQRCSISLLDFKVAMELNPQQLGEDWPLLLEKICMHSLEE